MISKFNEFSDSSFLNNTSYAEEKATQVGEIFQEVFDEFGLSRVQNVTFLKRNNNVYSLTKSKGLLPLRMDVSIVSRENFLAIYQYVSTQIKSRLESIGLKCNRIADYQRTEGGGRIWMDFEEKGVCKLEFMVGSTVAGKINESGKPLPLRSSVYRQILEIFKDVEDEFLLQKIHNRPFTEQDVLTLYKNNSYSIILNAKVPSSDILTKNWLRIIVRMPNSPKNKSALEVAKFIDENLASRIEFVTDTKKSLFTNSFGYVIAFMRNSDEIVTIDVYADPRPGY